MPSLGEHSARARNGSRIFFLLGYCSLASKVQQKVILVLSLNIMSTCFLRIVKKAAIDEGKLAILCLASCC